MSFTGVFVQMTIIVVLVFPPFPLLKHERIASIVSA